MKIDCPTTCTASYAPKTPVTLTARSASFAGWSGACNTTSATCSLTMNSDLSVNPIFNAPSYTLTVIVISSGPASVTSNDMKIDCPSTCSASYAQGTPVTLSASAGQLLSWSSGRCPGTGSCTVTMSSDQTVTARFAAAQ